MPYCRAMFKKLHGEPTEIKTPHTGNCLWRRVVSMGIDTQCGTSNPSAPANKGSDLLSRAFGAGP